MSKKHPGDTVLRGVVEHIKGRSDAGKIWSAGTLLVTGDNRRRVPFAGNIYVNVGDIVAVCGSWINHEKYGRQFQVDGRVYGDGVTKEGLAAWLAIHPSAKGIGPAKAKHIVEVFGDRWEYALANEQAAIAKAARVPVENIRTLAADWAKNAEMNAVATKLAAYRLTENEIHRLCEKYGKEAAAVLESNPYRLILDLDGFGFGRVDAIAMKVGVRPDHPGRIEAAVEHCLNEKMRDDGSTCESRAELLSAAEKIITGEAAREMAADGIDRLLGDGRIVRTMQSGDVYYATKTQHRYEATVAQFCCESWQRNPVGLNPLGTVESMSAEDGLDESQMIAAALAFTYKGCLITGGAGSGKTTTMRSIVQAYIAGGVRRSGIRLCAPTAKAAKRLEEVVCLPAMTIHRLLGYNGRTWARDGDNHILDSHGKDPARVVIVDEASMLGNELAYRLFRAVGPQTAVILVGDHNQLQPVGPGAMLRDVMRHDIMPVAILDKCHRQTGDLERNSVAILDGRLAGSTTADVGGPWYVSKCTSQNSGADTVKKLFERVLAKHGFDRIADVQFLSPMKKGLLGKEYLDLALQRIHQRSLGVNIPEVPIEIGGGDEDDGEDGKSKKKPPPKLYRGDKVMQTENDYNRNVMNGYQGVVVSTEPLVIDFGDQIATIPPGGRATIELAYCITAHKAQGSEFPCAVVICHSTHGKMLTRNWLYTAVTRARKTCVIVGDDDGIKKAITTRETNQRTTLLPALAELRADRNDQAD